MVRYIDLQGQIIDDSTPVFAFFDTTTDKFLSFADQQTFESVEDFKDSFKEDPKGDINRFLTLIPNEHDTRF